MIWNESFLGLLGRWGLVLLAVFILFLLSIFPFEIAHLGEMRPAFILMAVYYWTITRPSLFPPPLVFMMGIILDFLTTYPLGMNAIVLVSVQWLTRGQRKFLLGQSFLVMWAGFALVALGSSFFQWVLFILFNGALSPVKVMLVNSVFSILFFPLAVLPLSRVNKALAEQASSPM